MERCSVRQVGVRLGPAGEPHSSWRGQDRVKQSPWRKAHKRSDRGTRPGYSCRQTQFESTAYMRVELRMWKLQTSHDDVCLHTFNVWPISGCLYHSGEGSDLLSALRRDTCIVIVRNFLRKKNVAHLRHSSELIFRPSSLLRASSGSRFFASSSE